MSTTSKSCAILLLVSLILPITLIQASWRESLPTYRTKTPPSFRESLPTYKNPPSFVESLPTYRTKQPKYEYPDAFDEQKTLDEDVLGEQEPRGYEFQAAFDVDVSGDQKTQNVIDSCWRKNPNWEKNRQELADCAKGFGSGALGGKGGANYVVTDDSDDPINPKPGTLRYGAIQDGPLWIIFQRDMKIKLGNELLVNSFKTIDGRGANVMIGNGGPCITIDHERHVIIHGITISDCVPGYPGMVRSSPRVLGHRGSNTAGSSDGDAISILGSSKIWIDHCHLSRATDGLIDVTLASNSITISNNFFTDHDKVILLGHADTFVGDKIMEATVTFNHFGPGCIERMPRVRFGYAHVANNRYSQWGMYAIGGSANPTILSEGNYFLAADNPNTKQVTKRETTHGPPWQTWKWRSSKDVFLNGAYFVQSGSGNVAPAYTGFQAFPVANGDAVPSLTSDAGPLPCVEGRIC